jgi:hypothetical protein
MLNNKIRKKTIRQKIKKDVKPSKFFKPVIRIIRSEIPHMEKQ